MTFDLNAHINKVAGERMTDTIAAARTSLEGNYGGTCSIEADQLRALIALAERGANSEPCYREDCPVESVPPAERGPVMPEEPTEEALAEMRAHYESRRPHSPSLAMPSAYRALRAHLLAQQGEAS